MPVRLPAEWEAQQAIMLTWPHPGSDWGDALASIYATFASIGAAVARGQRLLSVCETPTHQHAVGAALAAAGAEPRRLLFGLAASNDAWARDHGPLITLSETGPVVNDFTFNGWGDKFVAEDDDRITARLHAQGLFGPVARKVPGFVLEGGAVETDGQGTLLATLASIVDPARNPGMDRHSIEAGLAEHLGFSRFLWLEHGALSGDDTDGHIDTLARFADTSTILYQTVSSGHPDRPALATLARELAGLRRADGRPYRLVPLPCPGVHRDETGRVLPASYANFLIINASVLVPTYGSVNDDQAASVLASVFPGRAVVPIDCRAIIRQNGSLHCLTMQIPAALKLRDAQPYRRHDH